MDTGFLHGISMTTVKLRDTIIHFTSNGLLCLERMVVILALNLYSLLWNVDKSVPVKINVHRCVKTGHLSIMNMLMGLHNQTWDISVHSYINT